MERLWCASLLYSLLFLLSLAFGVNKVGSVQSYDGDIDLSQDHQRGAMLDRLSHPSSLHDTKKVPEISSDTNLWPKDDESKQSLIVQLYGGDIVLSEEQRAILEDMDNSPNTHRPERAVVSSRTDLWPDGIVPYELDPSLSLEARQVIAAAMEEYTVSTCIRFRLRYASDLHYVRFYDGGGCSSQVGRSGGEQVVSIGPECISKGIVMHEIFHTLGRWHEQSRPDRDQFVEINYNNIQSGFETNFDQISQVLVTTQGIPYDFDSIMHYEYNAFSQNGQATIEPIDHSVAIARLGQRKGFSTLDVSHINALYCGAPVGEWSTWTPWSDCPVSCNGGTQTRTRTCIDGLECPGSNIDHMRCSEENCPILASWGVWGEWSGCSQSCGGGRRTRLRTCLGGDNCIGMRHEHSNCNTEDCPFVQLWGQWSVWSACSESCVGGGMYYRTRVCTSSAHCTRTDIQQESCNSNITCEPVVSEWGPCSKLCGAGGLQFRTVGNDTENRTCNEQICHSEYCLAGVSHIGCYTLDTVDPYMMMVPASSSQQPVDQPVRTCALLAAGNGFSFFGLSNGTCYSGLNELHNYSNRSLESDLCRNGTGGEWSIDLYQITNGFELESSSNSIQSCGTDYCNVELPICSRAAGGCSVNVLLQLMSVVFVLLCVYSCR